MKNVKAKSESIVNDKGEKSYAIKCDYQLIHKGKLTQDWKHFVETGQFYPNWATAHYDIRNRINAILKKDCDKRGCNK